VNNKFVFNLAPEQAKDFLEHAEAANRKDEDCIIKIKTFVSLTFVPAKKKRENEKPKT
jgi:hypothetical protein